MKKSVSKSARPGPDNIPPSSEQLSWFLNLARILKDMDKHSPVDSLPLGRINEPTLGEVAIKMESSLSDVCKKLKALETSLPLNEQLVIRGPKKKPSLSASGEHLMAAAAREESLRSEVLAEFNCHLDHQATGADKTATVRIGTTELAAGCPALMRVIAKVQAKGNWHVIVESMGDQEQLLFNLKANKLDFFIGPHLAGQRPCAKVDRLTGYSLDLVVVMPPGDALALEDEKDIRAVLNDRIANGEARLYVLRANQEGLQDTMRELNIEHGVEMPTVSSILGIVESGLGISVIPCVSYANLDNLVQRGLISYRVLSAKHFPMAVYTPLKRKLQAAAQTVLETLLETKSRPVDLCYIPRAEERFLENNLDLKSFVHQYHVCRAVEPHGTSKSNIYNNPEWRSGKIKWNKKQKSGTGFYVKGNHVVHHNDAKYTITARLDPKFLRWKGVEKKGDARQAGVTSYVAALTVVHQLRSGGKVLVGTWLGLSDAPAGVEGEPVAAAFLLADREIKQPSELNEIMRSTALKHFLNAEKPNQRCVECGHLELDEGTQTSDMRR